MGGRGQVVLGEPHRTASVAAGGGREQGKRLAHAIQDKH